MRKLNALFRCHHQGHYCPFFSELIMEVYYYFLNYFLFAQVSGFLPFAFWESVRKGTEPFTVIHD
jgi:hypothetical protein